MGTKVIRDKIPSASGPVFTPDGRVNSLYLNELLDSVAKETSARLYRRYRAEVSLTGGLWGGSWYFTDECGYTRARFRRLYSLVSVPQIQALEDANNYNVVFWQYSKALADAFAPYGIALGEVEWARAANTATDCAPPLLSRCGTLTRRSISSAASSATTRRPGRRRICTKPSA